MKKQATPSKPTKKIPHNPRKIRAKRGPRDKSEQAFDAANDRSMSEEGLVQGDKQRSDPTSPAQTAADVVTSTDAIPGTLGKSTTAQSAAVLAGSTPKGAQSVARSAHAPTKEGKECSDPISSLPHTSHALTADTAPVSSQAAAGAKTAAPSGLAAKLAEHQHQEDYSPHLIVEARAGTGKTTTLVEGLKELMGTPSALTPSPQQRAVWDCMCLSRGKVKTVCFVAFNLSIADVLKTKVPPGVQAMTMHSMGMKAVCKAFPRVNVEGNRVSDLILVELGIGPKPVDNLDYTATKGKKKEFKRTVDAWWDKRNAKVAVITSTKRLVSLCKMNLVKTCQGIMDNVHVSKLDHAAAIQDAQDARLDDLATEYEVDLDRSIRREVFDLVPKILDRCKDPTADGRIDYDDMIWLPVILGLPVIKYDLLLVDEAQDLNRCQQELAKRAGKRLILCGDPKQAIYGFAGADANSMPRMAEELGHRNNMTNSWASRDRGCVTLPLTVTRRCGKAIVREANKIVPDFQAFDANPEGVVSQGQLHPAKNPLFPDLPNRSYRNVAMPGDMVLCRVNSVLVSQCLQLLKTGKRAFIQGRDVGGKLVELVEKLKAGTIADLITRVNDWCISETAKEHARPHPRESVIEGFGDKRDCITALTDGLGATEHPSAVIRKLESLFTDKREGIRLSSIHKAKGMEARRVFILPLPSRKKDMPPAYVMSWLPNPDQEFNLLYVAITRAIEELVYVS